MGLRFDVSGDSLSRTASLPSATTFSVSIWWKRVTDRNSYSCAWAFDDGGSNYAQLVTDVDGDRMSMWTSPVGSGPDGPEAGFGEKILSPAVANNDWWYFCFSKSGNDVIGYYAKYDATTLTAVPETNAFSGAFTPNKFWVGNDAFVDWLDGCTANLIVHDGVQLTAAEFEQQRWKFLPQKTDSLWCWLPMVHDTVANCALDYSGNGRNFTVGGTLAISDNPPLSWGGATRVVGVASSPPPPPATYIPYDIPHSPGHQTMVAM